jgi:hypothetical protein
MIKEPKSIELKTVYYDALSDLTSEGLMSFNEARNVACRSDSYFSQLERPVIGIEREVYIKLKQDLNCINYNDIKDLKECQNLNCIPEISESALCYLYKNINELVIAITITPCCLYFMSARRGERLRLEPIRLQEHMSLYNGGYYFDIVALHFNIGGIEERSIYALGTGG